jgi:hypothetical protein
VSEVPASVRVSISVSAVHKHDSNNPPHPLSVLQAKLHCSHQSLQAAAGRGANCHPGCDPLNHWCEEVRRQQLRVQPNTHRHDRRLVGLSLGQHPLPRLPGQLNHPPLTLPPPRAFLSLPSPSSGQLQCPKEYLASARRLHQGISLVHVLGPISPGDGQAAVRCPRDLAREVRVRVRVRVREI